MAIKKKTGPVVGEGIKGVVPSSATIPKRPIGFRWNNDQKKLLWNRDTNSVTEAKADHFEVWRSITGYNGTYEFLENETNPTSGSVEYTDSTSFQGYWYKIRAVNSKGDHSLFTHLVEHIEDAENCVIIFSFVDHNGTPIGNVSVTVQLVETAEILNLDGYKLGLTYEAEKVKVNSLSGFGEIQLPRSSKLSNRKYTFTVISKELRKTKDLTVPDAVEAWLIIDSSKDLTLQVRVEGV